MIARPETFPEVLATAFNPIRQSCENSVGVTVRLLEAIHTISHRAQHQEASDALKLHAEMVAHHSRNFEEQSDVKAIEEEFKKIMETLS